MPRKAPKEVIEHRITLGDYERKILNEAQNAYAFQKYASPLNSPVISVALLGGGAYLGLAYAFDWWPFKSQGGWSWESLMNNPVTQNVKRYNNGEAVAVTNELYQMRLDSANERNAEAIALLEKWKDKDGLFYTMQRTMLQNRIKSHPAVIQSIHDEFAARLEAATLQDEQWAQKQAEDQNQ